MNMLWFLLIIFAFFLDPVTPLKGYPQPIAEINPTLSIYSPGGDPPCFTFPLGGEIQSLSPKDLVHIAASYSAWNNVSRVVFITHSFKESVETAWMHILKNAILEKHPGTAVVLVGWGGGSGAYDPDIDYEKAVFNILSVGPWLGDVAEELKKYNVYIHGIGHSVGSHLMGLSARVSGTFDRITALDPSAPILEFRNPPDMRLQYSDASIVDVIHADGCTKKTTSNCWVTANNHYGILSPIGTIDFYPGYGELNPTTEPLQVDKSHIRAVNLYIASVLHPGLFKTNETLKYDPDPILIKSKVGLGKRRMIKIQTVQVTAEMGYWMDNGFIPKRSDPRHNFYISPQVLKTLDKKGYLSGNKIHKARRKRDIVDIVDCLVVPNGSAKTILSSIGLAVLLILAFL